MTDHQALVVIVGLCAVQAGLLVHYVLEVHRLLKRVADIERMFLAPGNSIRFEVKGGSGSVAGTAVGLHPDVAKASGRGMR